MSSSPETVRQRTAEAYAAYFGSVTPETAGDILPLVTDDIHFIDPFNDIRGKDKLVTVIHRMFEDVDAPSFTILDLAWSGDLCFMRWDFDCHQRWLGHWTVRGMTELQFSEDSLVSAHYDYWDASRHFYSKLPLVGPMIRFIARKAAVG
ncbi:nuclear transport factor 2 family protein [Coralliovum pocilloporae]|uniref:nuclear transport factor 2 family protein n=1 Tax=Coralliovum pocilloporae TaxID=3066369 RepID=UPI003306D1F8